MRGAEAWGDYQVQPWRRLSVGGTLLDRSLRLKSDSSDLLGVAQAGDDPARQAFLRVSLDVSGSVTDADLRYVSEPLEPRAPAYAELSVRMAGVVAEHAEIALAGRNLLHDRHPEYPQGTRIPRAFSVDLQWRF